MARIKHVVKNPYHLWAHQTYAVHGNHENHARNSTGNCSFDGTRAYSYRAVIANIFTNSKGERLYLVSPRTWSVTTSGHQSALRSAIPSDCTVVRVHELGGNYRDTLSDAEHRANVQELWNRVAEYNGKAKRARKAWSKECNERYAIETMQSLRAYVKFFKLKGKAFQVPADDVLAEAETRLATFQKERDKELAAEAKAWAEAERLRRIEAQESIDKWLAGESIRLPYLSGEAFLRINGDTVETSQGAEAPLDHVKRAMPIVLRAVKSGKEFWPGSESTIRLGHYTLRCITAEGDVHVGCHRFTRAEVERFAALL